MSPKFLIYLTVAAILMVLSAPAAEGTLFLTLCMLRSPFCPFVTTTPTCLTGKTWSPALKICG
ncbi:uncharacterized protein LOC115767442 [Drosophila novamexicana]|uniref:uncharacterized protein LOC115767442 n=1 Tax=Drosophila novamexicana TaxID=47314 RepID=UPI0011E5EEBC|nr:uncharacterized protein LOC115767442 [Drosophila novamexicana]